MMNLEQEALKFIECLQTLYFEQRDMGALLPDMMEGSSWIGTGARELCRNLEEAKTALSLEEQEHNGCFTVTKTCWDVSSLAENVCLVYGEITAKSDDPKLADQHNRVTAVCIRTDDGMKLSHLHLSNSDRAERTATELQEGNSQLGNLIDNIPGGVHQCKYDEGLTFLTVSQSFLTLVGYSLAEIKERFHNNFAEMVYPDDLVRIRREMAEQLACGDMLALEYRLLRSDGCLLWILDHAKRAVGEDGSQTFYCVLMDITKQKEERENIRLLLERHQIIMDQTTNIIFEWDILRDALTFSANWRKRFGYDPISENIAWKIPLSKNIHSEDMLAFVKIMEDTAAGEPYSETEFRIRDILGNFIWNRICATVQYDMQGRPVKAVVSSWISMRTKSRSSVCWNRRCTIRLPVFTISLPYGILLNEK